MVVVCGVAVVVRFSRMSLVKKVESGTKTMYLNLPTRAQLSPMQTMKKSRQFQGPSSRSRK